MSVILAEAAESHTGWFSAMQAGDYEAAWRINDRILSERDPAEQDNPCLPYHQRWIWDGRPWQGLDVLVRCYHGLGDTIQYARYLPLLEANVRRLTVEVQAALIPLLSCVVDVSKLRPFDWNHPLPPSECDLEIMELPHAMRVKPSDFSTKPYIRLPENFSVTPHLGVRADTLNIGLCWSAGDWDLRRSIAVETLVHACTSPAMRLFALQRGPAAIAEQPGILPDPMLGSPAVLDTAAMICALDLIITVDTMVAHLAGALGRPTFLLLHSDADWRWQKRRTDTDWYPSTRLFRQTVAGDWREPLDEIASNLHALAADLPEKRLIFERI